MDTQSGHWGPVTATLDLANYQFSHYVAEISNTFSNFFFIGISLYGARLSTQECLPTRFLVGFAGSALIGLGSSFFFHATLLYEAQLADELPMIYVASYLLAMLLESETGFGLRSTYSKILVAGVVVFDVLFTAASAYFFGVSNPVYHQCVFASLMVATLLREVHLLTRSDASRTLPDKKKAVIITILRTGLSSCSSLVKRAVGWPIAFFMEGEFIQERLYSM
ncbi:ceramidase-domain-containing protein [Lactarius hatsudake]|nr:ceramidase-domain-containing protein [Lactarius hatsudake]